MQWFNVVDYSSLFQSFFSIHYSIYSSWKFIIFNVLAYMCYKWLTNQIIYYVIWSDKIRLITYFSSSLANGWSYSLQQTLTGTIWINKILVYIHMVTYHLVSVFSCWSYPYRVGSITSFNFQITVCVWIIKVKFTFLYLSNHLK